MGASTALAGVKQLLIFVEEPRARWWPCFNMSDAIDANLLTRAKMARPRTYAVAVMADGKALFAKKEVKVTLGGCGG